MDGFKAFKYFQAIKLHFTSERYDVFEMNGRVTGTRASFEKRNDRGLFEKLAKKFDTDRELIQFLAANFAYGHRNVVYSAESDEYYTLWMRRKESITQVFKNDLSSIISHLEKSNISGEAVFSIENGMPELLNLYIGGYVSLETMVILQNFDDYLSKWEPIIMLWHDHFLVIRKSNRFVKFKKDRLQSIYDNFINELKELKS